MMLKIMETKGSIILGRKRKRHRFKMGLLRIQFIIHIDSSDKKQRKNALSRSLSLSVNKS